MAAGTIVASAQSVSNRSAGEGQANVLTTGTHDIVMRARVEPTCRMTGVTPAVTLSGATDDGKSVNLTLSGQGGFTVDCNTAYAVGLRRTAGYAMPSRGISAQRQKKLPTIAQATTARIAGAHGAAIASLANATAGRTLVDGPILAGFDTPSEAIAPIQLAEQHDYDVVVQVAGSSGPLQSYCVFPAAVGEGFVCDVLANSARVAQPMPRLHANMVITGSTSHAPEVEKSTQVQNHATADMNAAIEGAATADDSHERALVHKTMRDLGMVRTRDRLTLSLSARH